MLSQARQDFEMRRVMYRAGDVMLDALGKNRNCVEKRDGEKG